MVEEDGGREVEALVGLLYEGAEGEDGEGEVEGVGKEGGREAGERGVQGGRAEELAEVRAQRGC